MNLFFLILEEAQELRQTEFRNRAELIRIQTAKLVNMSGRSLKEGETITPHELWPFEWDEQTAADSIEIDKMTDEEIAIHNAQLAAMLD